MNKKLTLKLLVSLLASLSLISCGHKDDISKYINKTQNPVNREETQVNKNTNVDVTKENNIKQDGSTPELFIVAGGPNKVPGICEYSLAGINGGRKIKPPVSNKNSTCYVIENDENIYVDVIFEVYSLMNKAKMAGDMITTKIIIKNVEYPCFSLVESTDGTALEKNGSINPLETKRIHYLAEVPKVDSVTGEFEVLLTINGKDLSNKFSLDSLQYSIKENMQQDVKQSLTEEEYYKIIKEAKQKEQDYIDSITDPKVKQSVQTAYSAAVAESIALNIKYPDDTDTIDAALNRVLNGE